MKIEGVYTLTHESFTVAQIRNNVDLRYWHSALEQVITQIYVIRTEGVKDVYLYQIIRILFPDFVNFLSNILRLP